MPSGRKKAANINKNQSSLLNEINRLRKTLGLPDSPVPDNSDSGLLQLKEISAGLLKQNKIKNRLSRYLPERVVEKIESNPEIGVEGERRIATVVFADISGFTAMSEKLDAEEVVGVVNNFFNKMVEIVLRYRGSVDKFMGDALMSIFGVPITHGDDAERAVRAAIEMQEAMVRFNQENPICKRFPLAMSIGINTGLLVAGNMGTDSRMEFTVMGDAVNLSARLEKVARPGQIIISESVLKSLPPTIDCRARKEVMVKGKRKPIKIFLVKGERQAKSVMESKNGSGDLPVAGRKKELKLFESVIRKTCSKKKQTVLVSGEAGSGKSRLLQELRRMARAAGMRTITESCQFYSSSIAFFPIIKIIRTLWGIDIKDTDAVARRRIRAGLKSAGIRSGEWSPFLENLLSISGKTEQLDHLSGEQKRKKTFEVLLTLFNRLSIKQPLLLHIEDLHWSDSSTREFLIRLSRTDSGRPVLLAMDYRPLEDVSFPGAANLTEISLKNLSAADSGEMIKSLLGVNLVPRSFISNIYQKSLGNPLYIDQVINSCLAQGFIFIRNNKVNLIKDFTLDTIPDSVRELEMSRIDRLPEGSRKILQYASVIGRSFDIRILRDVTNLSENEIMPEINSLMTSRLFIPEAEKVSLVYKFAHPMTQEVAYESILKSRRSELHGRIGSDIERMYSHQLKAQYGVLAHHYYHSIKNEKALDYCLLAGDQAREAYANSEAITYYSQTLDVSGRSSEKKFMTAASNALRQRGNIFRLTGEGRKSTEDYVLSLATARKIGYKLGEGLAMNCIGVSLHRSGEPDQALKHFQNAVRILKGSRQKNEVSRALTNMGLIYYDLGEYKKSLHYRRKALKIEKSTGNEYGVALNSSNIGLTYMDLGDFRLARKYLSEALKIEQKLKDKEGESITRSNLGLVYMSEGNYTKARENLESSVRLAESIGDSYNIAVFNYYLGKIHLETGDYKAARGHAAAAGKLAVKIRDPYSRAQAMNLQGEIFQLTDKQDKALPLHESARAEFLKMEDTCGQIDSIRSLAAANFALGNYQAALDQAHQGRTMAGNINDLEGTIRINILLGEMYLCFGDTDNAVKYGTAARELADKHKFGSVFLKIYNLLVKIHINKDQLDQAALVLRKSNRLAGKSGSDRDKVLTGFINCEFHIRNGITKEAAKKLDIVSGYLNKSRDRMLTARYEYYRALCQRDDMNSRSFVRHIKNALKKAEGDTGRELRRRIYRLMAERCRQSGNLPAHKKYMSEYKQLTNTLANKITDINLKNT